jgi:hypothetical protein
VLNCEALWELFDHPPYSPDLYTYLPTWWTGWDHSASTIMRNWWTVSKRGRAHRQQTSTQAHKHLFPDTISVWIPTMTTLRSSWSEVCMYFLHIINICSLLVLLTAHGRLHSQ